MQLFPMNETICLNTLQAVLDCSLKGSLLVLVAWLFTIITRNRSAHLRCHIWSITLSGLVLIPVLTVVLPVWRVPMLPDLAGLVSYLRMLGSGGSEAGLIGIDPAPVTDQASAATGSPIGLWMDGGFGWAHWILLALICGACATAIWIGLSRLALHRIVSGAKPMDENWRSLVESLSEQQNLGRPVRLLKASSVRSGITVGTLRPQVILPTDAEEWSSQRKRLTISHELAHVKRWDALTEDLAVFVQVLYWFNPLVWLALKRLRVEREMDCDNRVINAGAKPSDYAQQLMEIAADLGTAGGVPWGTYRLAESAGLRDRLLHILNPRVKRGSSRGISILVAGLLLLAVSLPLAATNLWQDAQEAEDFTSVVLKEKSAKYWEMQKPKKRMASATYLAEQMLTAGRPDRAVGFYNDLLTQKPKMRPYYIEESEVNALGYRLLSAGKLDEAIAIFRINVSAFPKAWNAHDSLAEAYLAKGELELSRVHYIKSLKRGSEVSSKVKQTLKEIEKLQKEGQKKSKES